MTPGTEVGVKEPRTAQAAGWRARGDETPQPCTGQTFPRTERRSLSTAAPPAGQGSVSPPSAHLCWSWACSPRHSWQRRAQVVRWKSRRSSSLWHHWSRSPLQPSQLKGHHCSWSRSNRRLTTNWLDKVRLNNIPTLNKALDFRAESNTSAKTSWQLPGSASLGDAETEPSRWLINNCNFFLKMWKSQCTQRCHGSPPYAPTCQIQWGVRGSDDTLLATPHLGCDYPTSSRGVAPRAICQFQEKRH